MIGAERLVHIKEIVKEKGFISVKEIMEQFGVSRSSAMRDLDELEKQGIVKRQRGGAITKEKAGTLTPTNEKPVREKATLQDRAKKMIAERASHFLKDGDCIFLDGGTTTSYLIPYIENLHLTIVTPNIYLLKQMSNRFKGKIYLLGGEYQMNYDMSYGALATQMIRKFRFDTCFISANGLDPVQDVTVFDCGIGEVKSEVMERSDLKVLMVDSSKFLLKGMYAFAQAHEFDEIITDSLPDIDEIPDNIVNCI